MMGRPDALVRDGAPPGVPVGFWFGPDVIERSAAGFTAVGVSAA
jgi:hypothetical protein